MLNVVVNVKTVVKNKLCTEPDEPSIALPAEEDEEGNDTKREKAASYPVETCPADLNMNTASVIPNAFHGLLPHYKEGEAAEKDIATVCRDLPNVATAS